MSEGTLNEMPIPKEDYKVPKEFSHVTVTRTDGEPHPPVEVEFKNAKGEQEKISVDRSDDPYARHIFTLHGHSDASSIVHKNPHQPRPKGIQKPKVLGHVALYPAHTEHGEDPDSYETHSELHFSRHKGHGLGKLMYSHAIDHARKEGKTVQSAPEHSSDAERLWKSTKSGGGLSRAGYRSTTHKDHEGETVHRVEAFHTCSKCEYMIEKQIGIRETFCPNCGTDMTQQESYPRAGRLGTSEFGDAADLQGDEFKL